MLQNVLIFVDDLLVLVFNFLVDILNFSFITEQIFLWFIRYSLFHVLMLI